MQYTAVSSGDGYSLSYNIGSSGSGNTRGSGMADTILNGSGNYQTRQVNNDDYRAQEFPNGSATTAYILLTNTQIIIDNYFYYKLYYGYIINR